MSEPSRNPCRKCHCDNAGLDITVFWTEEKPRVICLSANCGNTGSRANTADEAITKWNEENPTP